MLRTQAAASSPGFFSARSSAATRPIAAAASLLCDMSDRLIAQTFEDEPRAVGKAEQRQAVMAWLGAALGAAGDMQVEAEAFGRLDAGDLGGDGASRDMAGGAGRRARAGGDRTARVGGIDDEAGRLRGVAGRPRPRLRDGQMSSSARRGARRISAAPRRSAARMKSISGVGADLAEGQGDRHGEAGVGEGEDGMTSTASKSRSTSPPSVLPDISPTRGEIGCSAFAHLQRWRLAKVARQPISPLEGEMSGRTEGGTSSADCHALQLQLLSFKSRARPFLPSAATAPRIDSVAAQAASSVEAAKQRRSRFSHLPATAIRQTTAAVARSAVSLTSAVDLVQLRPPAAIDDDRHLRAEPRFQPAQRQCPCECARQAASDRRSPRGSSPASGAVSTGTPVRTAMPSASTSRDSPTADRAVSPLICRLPRAVTSTMPLPWLQRRFAQPDQGRWARILKRPD